MSSWSDLYSKIEASSNKPNLRNDFGKDEYVLPNVSYEEFDKVPGKSVSLLNNDSAWNSISNNTDTDLLILLLILVYYKIIINIFNNYFISIYIYGYKILLKINIDFILLL